MDQKRTYQDRALQLLDEERTKIDMGELYCRPEDRPLDTPRYSLWSDGDSSEAFSMTEAAWDIFRPVNG